MVLRTSLQVPSIVVLVDSWHPNWRARVDGESAYAGAVDIAFRGVAVPAGDHRIELQYAPKTKHVGQLLSALTAAWMAEAAIEKESAAWRRSGSPAERATS